jgi:hypothetical protein
MPNSLGRVIVTPFTIWFAARAAAAHLARTAFAAIKSIKKKRHCNNPAAPLAKIEAEA